jgi:hypothetical protein
MGEAGVSDSGSGWWASGHDDQWHEGAPPAGWQQAGDGRWYPPIPPPPPEWDSAEAYEPAHAATPSGWPGLAETYRRWPRWARIGAPVSVALVAFIALGAVVGEPDQNPDEVAVADESEPTTTERPSTTVERVTTTTTTAPPATTTTAPPTTTTTAPPPPPPPPPPPDPAPPPPPPPPPNDCHPSYDPCLPIVSDVDCVGGSGDGPVYTGTVNVIGPDEYDLDRDGDGVGCD